MTLRPRGRIPGTALLLLAALLGSAGAAAPGFAATAAARNEVGSAPPTLPEFEPVSLHAFAATVGGEVSWLERNRKLRLQTPRHGLIFEVDRREVLVDGLRVFLGEAPKAGGGTLSVLPIDRDRVLLPLLAPRKFGPRPPIRTIMLDAGHGGRDKGTRNDPLKLLEKDLALDVVRRLEKLLTARGYQVGLTRTDDTLIDLGERPHIAARAHADLFLSVHFNAGPPSVSGIEVYRVTPQFQRSTGSDKLTPDDAVAVPGNAWDAWNTLLGFTIHRQLDQDLGRFDRGLKHARFVVIRDLAVCPGVLIECGYLSNVDEAKLIALPAHREQIASAIASGVDAYAALFDATSADAVATPVPERGAIRAPRTSSSR